MCGCECVCVFKRQIKEGLTEKLMFESNLKEGNKGGSCADFWGKSIPGGGNSQCKGPEAGACLVCAKISEECVVGAGRREGHGRC